MIPVIKNEEYVLLIEDLTHEAYGVAKIDGYPIFIENGLVGEECLVKIIKVGKYFAFGKILTIYNSSSDRNEVIDAKGTWTGTMPLQHMKYEKQLLFKQQQVENVMDKVAKMPEVKVNAVLAADKIVEYRNKAQIPVRNGKDGIITGFFRKNTHTVIPIDNFIIQEPVIDEAILVIREILNRYGILGYDEDHHSGEVRHIIVRYGKTSKQLQVTFVTLTKQFRFKDEIVAEIVGKINNVASIVQNINPIETNTILGKETVVLYNEDKMWDMLLGYCFEMSSLSFYQVNPKQTEKLYQKAIDMAQLSKDDIVIDAYCGIGTIGIILAKQVKYVYGMEIVEDAIVMARNNAKLNNVMNITFEAGAAENVLPKWKKVGANVLFVDPPRKGLAKSFIDTAVTMEFDKIVYISCNSATLARDLRLFGDNGYQVLEVQPVDMFPQTLHVECIALIQRVK